MSFHWSSMFFTIIAFLGVVAVAAFIVIIVILIRKLMEKK
ncbi:hypothetical protein J40TS1_26190 [Paenibacillus montaniterrae]|uniref:Uncharacterized protein n=1 Tax=Paenibacillus montaniterrae TaxID=429341 RepID=A0A919YPK0_9BACL|nr:hypothetical protein J40TS1_26190 [Paenibacillus montaniterrae]